MLTKLLDIFALLAATGSAYYHYTQAQPALDLTPVFLIAISLTVFSLSAVIKNSYVDLIHGLLAVSFGYFSGVPVALGYLVSVLIVRRYVYAQLSVAVLFSMGVLFLIT